MLVDDDGETAPPAVRVAGVRDRVETDRYGRLDLAERKPRAQTVHRLRTTKTDLHESRAHRRLALRATPRGVKAKSDDSHFEPKACASSHLGEQSARLFLTILAEHHGPTSGLKARQG
ncbi:MAG TPA: hypothetical protein VLM85_27030 [Polyangiaceae bacterium]|nr:hypothetical protein [Polyangiaceae bacterium]